MGWWGREAIALSHARAVKEVDVTDTILYFKRGYKYQVSRDFHATLVLPFPVTDPVKTDYLELDQFGNLLIKKGYAWDGASGPTWDTQNSMRGSLVHDAGYQLIRLGLVDPRNKEYFDQVLHDLCTQDGMWGWRADYWRWAVLEFGAGSTRPSAEPQEERAP